MIFKMILTTSFILSQIVIWIAMIFDFLSFQVKKREHTIFILIISAILVSLHYYLLNKTTASAIVLFSVIRFIVSYFSTNKKILLFFIFSNFIILYFTFKEYTDFIIFVWLIIFIIGNFQENNKKMRFIMMLWTTIALLYNLIIFSPMGVISEFSFLISNIIGYYRFYIKK